MLWLKICYFLFSKQQPSVYLHTISQTLQDEKYWARLLSFIIFFQRLPLPLSVLCSRCYYIFHLNNFKLKSCLSDYLFICVFSPNSVTLLSGIVTNVLDYNSKRVHIIIFPFGHWKYMNIFISRLWVELYYKCSSTRIALALNNPQK